ncbi:type II secretion system major pseudopilin GspG [Chthonomonas calidirosea]|uniref:type II secretion system major pseudopilin GspG n=1 Tax=Chthonomonas calidirosea TaxID=454171 RepID=UPI0006EC43E3|nr:type II secretion system major pseudopilin GspG [Chthonomonas calidirosea]CEK14838.1 type II secretion system protein G [Chthonomonas calidirosea]
MSQPAKKIRRAFTLIEILVVVVILAILAAIVVPNVISRIKDAKISAAIADIKAFDNAIDQYKLDMGTVPPSLDALITPPSPRGKWNGPYLKNIDHIPLDPWGNPYIYKVPGSNGREYDLYSAGPDGQPGTSDDIQDWNLKGQ